MKALLVLAWIAVFAVFLPPTMTHLHPGRTKALAVKLQNDSRAVATSVRNLKINTTFEKNELIVMANEFTHKFLEAIYVDDQAVQHVKSVDYRGKIEKFIMRFLDFLHDIQRAIYGDIVILQEKLAHGLEEYAKSLDDIMLAFAQHQTGEEIFTADRFRKASDIAFLTVHKLQSNVAFFTTTNAELAKEIERGVSNFESSFKKLASDDEDTRQELTHLTQYLSQLGIEVAMKLQYWMGVNAQREGYQTVKETSVLLGELAGKLQSLSLSNRPVQELSQELAELFKTGALQIKKLGELVGSPGDQENVRSVLLDVIAVGNTFAEEIDIFTSMKNVHSYS